MKKLLILLISLFLGINSVYAAEDVIFSCSYDDFKFDFDRDNDTGEITNAGKNTYSLRVDVYEDEIKIYANNILLENNKMLYNDYGIDGPNEASQYYQPNAPEYTDIKFNYNYDMSAFTSNGKYSCPNIIIDTSEVYMNATETLYLYNNITNMDARLEFSATKGPFGGNSTDENSDKILFDCSNGTKANPYYYAPGSYGSTEDKTGLVLNEHLSFNIIKYESGKVLIETSTGSLDKTIEYSNGNSSGSVWTGEIDLKFKDLGSLDSCPNLNDLYFCKSGSDYIVTANKSNCSDSDKATTLTDKENAEQIGSKFDVSNIGGSVSTAGLSCDKLFSGEHGTKLKKFIQSAFTIVKVVSICICVMMGVIDFVTATSKDKDVLMENVNKTIKRLVIVIVILLLPTLIDTLGGIFGVSTCGIR